MKIKNSTKFVLVVVIILSFFLKNATASSVSLNKVTTENGILVDVARCHLNKQDLEKIIKTINSKKFDYIILHLNDNEHVAFRTKILGNKNSQDTLNIKDLEEITKDAQHRGLTIIPDFDTPGHCKALIKLLKEHNPKLAHQICFDSNTLNYTKYATVRFTEHINAELNKACDAQNERYILLGGDEVAASETNNRSLIKYFNRLNVFENHYGFHTIVWNDSILKNSDLNKKITVAYWAQGGGNSAKKILQNEYYKRANVVDLICHPLINANAGYDYFNLDNLNNSRDVINFINRLNSNNVKNFDLIDLQTLTNNPDCYQQEVKGDGHLICLWGNKNSKVNIKELLNLIKKLNEAR